MLEKLKSILQEPPPAMAFEISEAGIAAARIGARAELDFQPLRPGTVSVSPIRDNVINSDEFVTVVRSLAGTQTARKRKDVALILPDYSTRISVLDFDQFPKEAPEQTALIRFRLKRSVPFDVESAAMSYYPQALVGGRIDVVVAMAPLEIVSPYEAPFRAAGLNPGLVTTSSLAVLDLAPESGLSVIAKLSGHVLSVLVRDNAHLKLVRCLELPSTGMDDIASVLIPTFVYIEDNLGRAADTLLLCGFGPESDEIARRFETDLSVKVETLRSPLGAPGENNAGLLGYLRSIAKNN